MNVADPVASAAQMAEQRNPAGRLHDLLSQFAKRADAHEGMRSAWAAVLDVSESDVPFRLGQVGDLFREVRAAAEDVGRGYTKIPAHLTTLSKAIYPHKSGLIHEAVRPDKTALDALGMFSAYLEDVRPDGRIPDNDELEPLREQTRQLLSDVAAADLPPEIKRALQHRLAEVLEALDNLSITGPDAVARAAEALATVATLAEDSGADSMLTVRLKRIAKTTWIAVQVATVSTTLALNWDRIVDEKALRPAPEVRQIGPAPSCPDDSAQDPDMPSDDVSSSGTGTG